MSRLRRSLLLAALLVLCVGCAATSTAPVIPGAGFQPTSPGPSGTYVAIGASDTVGVGADDPLRESWPHVFANSSLNRGTAYVNLGISGATTESVDINELPLAVTLHPTVVTVFVGVNDVINGVSVGNFTADFYELMRELSATGASVMVADIPVLDSLPAVRACIFGVSDGPNVSCPTDQIQRAGISTLAQLDARVAAFNQVIRNGVAQYHVTLVDLAALGDYVAAQPDLVSDDGFHPSDRGHRQLAQLFAAAYKTAAAAPHPSPLAA